MPQLNKNNVLQVIEAMFLGIYLAKYSQIFGFPFQQAEYSNFHIFSQKLILYLIFRGILSPLLV